MGLGKSVLKWWKTQNEIKQQRGIVVGSVRKKKINNRSMQPLQIKWNVLGVVKFAQKCSVCVLS